MPFSLGDLHQLEDASRRLASPLAAPSAEAWLLDAGVAVRDLVGGTGVVLQFPTASASYFSEDTPEVASGVLDYVQEVHWDGTRFSDPVVDVWARIRQASRMETCSWDINEALVRGRGLDIRDAPIVMDVLIGQRAHDYVAMMGNVREGEAMIWVLHQRYGAFRFGEATTEVLSALLPSFRVGLDALVRLDAHRAMLDALTEPLAAYGPDGQEVYRNPSLAGLLTAHPEAAALEAALRRLGAQARTLARPLALASAPFQAEDTVPTAQGRCTLRATSLPPGLFGADPALLVTVQGPRALPSPEAVREQHALTRREAEVALLLAEGLSNAALADRLFVSPHTARHHVESVLAKLDLSSRSAVAARLLGA